MCYWENLLWKLCDQVLRKLPQLIPLETRKRLADGCPKSDIGALVDPVEAQCHHMGAPFRLAVARTLAGHDLLAIKRHGRVLGLLANDRGGQVEA